MDIQIQKLTNNAKIPAYSYKGDAGLDLTATSINVLNDKKNLIFEYGTGISVAIPEGYVGLLFPRSSISKYTLTLCNSVGVIDSNYRGEIKCRFSLNKYNPDAHTNQYVQRYNIGDRIAQLVIIPYPQINFIEVTELSDSVRNMAGFGSSGQ